MSLQSKLRSIIISRDYESLKTFLDEFKDVNLNYVHPKGYLTTIAVALAYNSNKCIKLLVEHGMNIDQPYACNNILRDFNGMSPLLVEAKFGCVEKVKFLLKIGASLYFRTESGQNILDVTTDNKIKKIILKHLSKERLKLQKTLYNSVKTIDNYIIQNIIDFLYPKI